MRTGRGPTSPGAGWTPTARADGTAGFDHDELAAIVASSDDGIISTDLDGVVRSWNAGAAALLGWTAVEMIGRPVKMIVPANRHPELDSVLSRVAAGLPAPTRDTWRLHRDGHQVDVAVLVSLIRDAAGHPTGFAAVLRDITERKLAEREQRRLLAEATRRERWLAAISEVRLALLGGGSLDGWLDLLVRQAADLSRAEGAAVLLPDEEQGSQLTLRTTRGLLAAPGAGDDAALTSGLAAAVFESGRARSTAGELGGPAQLAVPLTTSNGVTGVLLVVRAGTGAPFDAEDIRMVEGFAAQAALALELARARADREQLALLADRERIARDLHDHVIQRLFAVGMSLQAVTGALEEGMVLTRIDSAVDELDATIRQIRSAIFSLEVQARRQPAGTRSRVLQVANEATAALGFSPRLQFSGPIDTRVPEAVVPDLLAVVREGLSNIARHAQATTAEVRLQVGDELVVCISDDGRGLGPTRRRSGLRNLQARATQRGGSFDLGDVPGGGLLLRWTVPLPR